MSISSMTKEGSFLLISICGRANPVKIDCRDFSITSFTGRAVKHIPTAVMEDLNYQCWGIRQVIGMILEIKKENSWSQKAREDFRKIEPFLTVIELVDNIPEECPTGYIKFVKDNDYRICRSSLSLFKAEKKFKNLSKEDKETIDLIISRFATQNNVISFLRQLTHDDLKTFLKVFRLSMKNFNWNFELTFGQFIESVKQLRGEIREHWTDYLDINRTLEYNTKIFRVLRHKEKEPYMIATQDRIRHITAIESEHFKVIVPTCLEDYADEGEQQNNCVGYFYHDQIARGEYAIYFIRRKDKPEKSNTTCRYDLLRNGGTIECKIKNNEKVTDREVLALIKEIDRALANRNVE